MASFCLQGIHFVMLSIPDTIGIVPYFEFSIRSVLCQCDCECLGKIWFKTFVALRKREDYVNY